MDIDDKDFFKSYLQGIHPFDLLYDVKHKDTEKVSQSSSIPLEGCGGLEPIPAVIGRAVGYTLDRSPVCRRAFLKE